MTLGPSNLTDMSSCWWLSSPHTSWTILLTTTVDPISWGRACSFASGGWDVWLLLRVLVISANPGKGACSQTLVLSSEASILGFGMVIPSNQCSDFCFCLPWLPGGVFTHWVKIFDTPVFWLEPAGVFTVERTVCFECPKPMVGPAHLILVPWFLLLLHSHRGEGSRVSVDLEGVTHTQFEGFISSNTWSSVKVVNGSIHSLNSLMHSACWHDLPNGVGLDKLAQCWRTLAYTRVFCGCLRW